MISIDDIVPDDNDPENKCLIAMPTERAKEINDWLRGRGIATSDPVQIAWSGDAVKKPYQHGVTAHHSVEEVKEKLGL